MKVCFADDDNTMRLYFSKFFTKKGYEVDTFEDGATAWEAIQKNRYPLVILDWNMPNMTGLELCGKIKEASPDGFTYVILITSNNSSDEISEGLEHGADDYLTKPVAAAELEARIASAMRVITYEEELKEKERSVSYSCYQTLTELAETRDQESKDHMQRIGDLSAVIAKEMGQPEEFCEAIRLFAPMHDIGKVGIPDGVLHSPRHLYQEEYDLVKLHTTIGWQILRGKPAFEMGAVIAYTHHEHWDGSGYPRHLEGNDIPLEGRIAIVADTYDSLRSIKNYSRASSHAEAMEYLKKNSGVLFDPRVISAAESVGQEMNTIFNTTYRVDIAIRP